MRLFKPDRYFVSVLDIKPQEIIDAGYKGIVLDLDNTILPRTEKKVPRNLKKWVKQVQKSGIEVVFLSNNWHGRIVKAAKKMNVELVTKALKPCPHGFLQARWHMGTKRKNTLVLGDQTFTDILGGHILGMESWLVKPLATQDLKHTKILRNVDKIALRKMQPEGCTVAYVAKKDAKALI
ncbi:MAG: YqeG family HAD IIIA-type phosphatase [Coriobacteriales bacterium]|nr:YqeG family HAD IIIA-type phosphatase [Coriobacteriales bacterium]